MVNRCVENPPKEVVDTLLRKFIENPIVIMSKNTKKNRPTVGLKFKFNTQEEAKRMKELMGCGIVLRTGRKGGKWYYRIESSRGIRILLAEMLSKLEEWPQLKRAVELLLEINNSKSITQDVLDKMKEVRMLIEEHRIELAKRKLNQKLEDLKQ